MGDGNPELYRGYPEGLIPLPSVCSLGILPVPRPSTCQCASPASAGSQHSCLGQDLDGSNVNNDLQAMSVSQGKPCSTTAGALCRPCFPTRQEAGGEIVHFQTNKLRLGEVGLLTEGSHSSLRAELRLKPLSVSRAPGLNPGICCHGVGSGTGL